MLRWTLILCVAVALTRAQQGEGNNSPEKKITCTREEYVYDPDDCRTYYECSYSKFLREYLPVKGVCQPDTVFSKEAGNTCVSARLSGRRECQSGEEEAPNVVSGSSETTSVTAPTDDEITCKKQGFLGDPRDCTKFYLCVVNGINTFKRYEYVCPEKTVWESQRRWCVLSWATSRDECKTFDAPPDEGGAPGGPEIVTEPDEERSTSPSESTTVTAEESTMTVTSEQQPEVTTVIPEESTATTSEQQSESTTVLTEQSTMPTSEQQPEVTTVIPEESTTTTSEQQPEVSTVIPEESTTTTSEQQPEVSTIIPEESTTMTSEQQSESTTVLAEQSTTPTPAQQSESTTVLAEQSTTPTPAQQTDSTTVLAEQSTTPTSAQQSESTTVLAEQSTTPTPAQQSESTTVLAEQSTTPAPAQQTDSTTVLAEQSTTPTPAQQTDSTTVLAEQSTTSTSAQQTDSTTVLAEQSTTPTPAQQSESTTVLAEQSTTPTSAQQTDSTTVLAEQSTTPTPAQQTDSTTVLAEQSTTPTPAQPSESTTVLAEQSTTPTSAQQTESTTVLVEQSTTSISAQQSESTTVAVEQSTASVSVQQTQSTTRVPEGQRESCTGQTQALPELPPGTTPSSCNCPPVPDKSTPAVPETDDQSVSTRDCPVGKLSGDQIALVCPTGFRRHPKYCNLFYQCTTTSPYDYKVFVLSCPGNSVFDASRMQCLSPDKLTEPCQGQMMNVALRKTLRKHPNLTMNATEKKICPGVGHYPVGGDFGDKYYRCLLRNDGRLEGYLVECPPGYAFWSLSRRCEKADEASRRTTGTGMPVPEP